VAGLLECGPVLVDQVESRSGGSEVEEGGRSQGEGGGFALGFHSLPKRLHKSRGLPYKEEAQR